MQLNPLRQTLPRRQPLATQEPASCEYVVVIHTPLVCGHDAFVLEEEPLATINCVMVDADGKVCCPLC